MTAIDNTLKTITLSSTRTLGTVIGTSATARTITIGGAWSGMSGTTTFPFSIATWSSVTNAAGDRVRINVCGSFSVTTSCTFAGTGIVIEGYSTTAGDKGLATIDYTGVSDTFTFRIGTGGGVMEARSLWCKNNTTAASPASAAGMVVGELSGVGFSVVSGCRFSDCGSHGLLVSSGTSVNSVVVKDCEFYDCYNGNGANGSCLRIQGDVHASVRGCIFHDNGSSVLSCIDVTTGHVSVEECVFDSNVVGFDDSNAISPKHCIFYNNTTAFKITPGSSRFGVYAIGCIFENNTTAISRGNTTADRQPIFEQCVFYNNSTKLDSNATGRVFLVNCIDATRSTMVDPANGDFRTKESNLRNAIDSSLLQSSSSYTAFTTRCCDIGIGPSNPYYNGQ